MLSGLPVLVPYRIPVRKKKLLKIKKPISTQNLFKKKSTTFISITGCHRRKEKKKKHYKLLAKERRTADKFLYSLSRVH
jgi:hypothetical protein